MHHACIIMQKKGLNYQRDSCIKQCFVLEYREILENLIIRCIIIRSVILQERVIDRFIMVE